MMRLRISDSCSRLVERVGTSWPYLGWVLFIAWLVYPFFVLPFLFSTPNVPAAMLGLTWVFDALWLIWWLIDVVDQQVAIWQVAVGIVMLGIGYLPRGGLLTLATWLIYWTKVRE